MMAVDWKTIREAFKAARKARGLDQRDVAGMQQGMISKLESAFSTRHLVGDGQDRKVYRH
jgi:transcriptional regulator with XRE-family HTH domain